MRPMDLKVTRRNHRTLQVQRLLRIAANVVLVALVAAASLWLYQRMQQDRRFAIQRVETAGAEHTSPAAIQKIASKYVGSNLFKLDIAALRGQLLALPWIESVAIEKKIPNTLIVRITERKPIALAAAEANLRYVDNHGLSFAPLSVGEGNPELPIITGARPDELPRTVDFLQHVRRERPELFARISEIAPVAPDAFQIFDRDIRTVIVMKPEGYAEKWQQLYSIVRQEGLQGSAVEYADLRFKRRVIIRTRNSVALASSRVVTAPSTGITN